MHDLTVFLLGAFAFSLVGLWMEKVPLWLPVALLGAAFVAHVLG